MTRKVVRLTLDNLAELPEPVRSCLFWERDPVTRTHAVRAGEECSEKEAWVSHTLLEWGSCGRVVQVDGRVAGYLLYAPPAYFPGALSLPTAPASEDAVLLATAYVDPELRRGGLGRMLVQGMAKDLVKRGGFGAIEAFGSTREREDGCILPADYLLGVGFKTQRPHPSYPRLRLDLKSALTWREEIELAVEKLVGAVVPTRRPAPEARHTQ